MKNFISKLRTLIAITAFVALSIFSAHADGIDRTKPVQNILVINAYNEGAPWSQSFITPLIMEAAKIMNSSSR